jgi:hypothetical protein
MLYIFKPANESKEVTINTTLDKPIYNGAFTYGVKPATMFEYKSSSQTNTKP